MKYPLFAMVIIGCMLSCWFLVLCFMSGASAVQQGALACVAIATTLIPYAIFQSVMTMELIKAAKKE